MRHEQPRPRHVRVRTHHTTPHHCSVQSVHHSSDQCCVHKRCKVAGVSGGDAFHPVWMVGATLGATGGHLGGRLRSGRSDRSHASWLHITSRAPASDEGARARTHKSHFSRLGQDKPSDKGIACSYARTQIPTCRGQPAQAVRRAWVGRPGRAGVGKPGRAGVGRPGKAGVGRRGRAGDGAGSRFYMRYPRSRACCERGAQDPTLGTDSRVRFPKKETP